MNNINVKQNENKILKYLFCQRFMYKKYKKIAKFIFLISMLIWILGLIPYASETFDHIKLTVSGIGIFGIIIAEIIGDRLREVAVDYQEYIDRSLFEFRIDKNIIPNLSKLDNKANDIIISNKGSFEKEIEPNYSYSLYDWYSDVSQLPLDIARVVCQNENIRWENRQRKLYSNILICVITCMVATTIIKINILNESYFNILTLAPIVGELLKTIIKNNVVTKSILEIEEIISELYINIENRGIKYNKKKIKEQSLEIQVRIRKYRLNNVSIPEFIYKKMKVKEQNLSSEFIQLKVDEILSSI